jgi:competence protein ComEA
MNEVYSMERNKKTTYVIVAISCAVLFLIWYLKQDAGDSVQLVTDPTPAVTELMAAGAPPTETETATETPPVKVYITGAVKNPGVYEIEDGARIETVLALAGGATDDADLKAVNLSKKVHDEQQIIIPAIGEEIDPLPETPAAANGKIDINTAEREQLMTLPGIGEGIADAIIEYREANGAFQTAEDIKNVDRIGDKTFERLKNDITVGGQ